MNLPLEEESLVFVEEYLSTIHVVMIFSVREYTLSVVCRIVQNDLTDLY